MGFFSKKNNEQKIDEIVSKIELVEVEESEDLFPEDLEGIARTYYYNEVKVTRFCDDDRPIKAGAGGFLVDDDEAMVAMIENDNVKQMVADYVDRGDLVKVAFTGSDTVAIGFYRK